MKPEKVKGRDGTKKIEVEILYQHEDYNFFDLSWEKTGTTGLLTVAMLKPKRESLPEFRPKFRFRWDEKVDDLDVDILEVSDDIEKCFKEGKNGYEGHHTTLIPDCGGRRVFKALIKIPGIIVFDGYIIVPLRRGLRGKVSISTRVTGKLQVLKKTEQ